MKTEAFDYELLPELIAQTPVEPRDAARLLVYDRKASTIAHRHFRDLGDYLQPGDVLVFNQTRVLPARLKGRKVDTGGKVEALLLRRESDRTWRALIGGKRVRLGTRLELDNANGMRVEATVVGERERSERTLEFAEPITPLLSALGEVPLPPYIHTPLADPERYQTVYGRDPGSAAAPTAGLHFTPELLARLRQKGVQTAFCTLHIGLDTFHPLQAAEVEDHLIHSEHATLSADDARTINTTRQAGGRLVAVGTTVVRTLESSALKSANEGGSSGEVNLRDPVVALDEETSLYITPGYQFKVVDALVTNFHLPRSTLLVLVSAFAGTEEIRRIYRAAIDEGYRFYSFGDACLFL